jgi:hypothetical protein
VCEVFKWRLVSKKSREAAVATRTKEECSERRSLPRGRGEIRLGLGDVMRIHTRRYRKASLTRASCTIARPSSSQRIYGMMGEREMVMKLGETETGLHGVRLQRASKSVGSCASLLQDTAVGACGHARPALGSPPAIQSRWVLRRLDMKFDAVQDGLIPLELMMLWDVV